MGLLDLLGQAPCGESAVSGGGTPAASLVCCGKTGSLVRTETGCPDQEVFRVSEDWALSPGLHCTGLWTC